ncbi:MAG: 2Fe-2S iron-sulfur cluster-binding protein, partial [Defluviitaleaceae bacterium]|nr:2Fe-2S iron-sulfur cluster-binding protein [Defluviitaleaceae bacterium]
MPSITFLPDNITVTVPEGAPLLEAARLAGVFVETPCGGRGTCGKCAVRVASGAVDFRRSERILAGAGENEMGERARAGAAAPGKSVLICQTFVKDEPVTVELLGKSGEKGKFDLDADISRYMPEKMEPFLKYVALTVARPALLDGLSDLDRFARAFREAVKCADVRLPIGVLAELPEKLRESDGEIKVFYYIDCMDGGVARVVDVCSGRVAENSPLGLA